MRISELSRQAGVSIPTIKFYVREGLLPPGDLTSATQATYGERHVRRLRLIRVLREVADLPVPRIREIVALIDRPGESLFDTLGQAIEALPPYLSASCATDRATALLDRVGLTYEPNTTAVQQLARALDAVDEVDLPADDARLDVYAEHASAIAAEEIAGLPRDAAAALEYSVLGTALYEPVLAALRRIAHQHHARRLLDVLDAG